MQGANHVSGAIARSNGATTSPAAENQAAATDRLKVFISYSRDDLDFADQLDAALQLCGFTCTLDRQAISGGEEWKQRLGHLIQESDTVAFVLSPASAVSPICAWEVEEAARLGKRIIPVVCRNLQDARPPARLSDLNYIFFHSDAKVPGSGFGSGMARLAAALKTDLDWLREHTRLLQRALEWDAVGRQTNRLLSGSDIDAAKAWVAGRPSTAPMLTELHFDFIRASENEEENRSAAAKQQLEQMARVHEEREQAIRLAEKASLQRARFRIVAFSALTLTATLSGWQWWRAEREAEKALRLGEEIAELNEIGRPREADDALRRLVRQIAELTNLLALEKSRATSSENELAAVQRTLASVNAEYAKLAAVSNDGDETRKLGTARLAALSSELEEHKKLSNEAVAKVDLLNQQLVALRRQIAALNEALEISERKDVEAQERIRDLGSRLNEALARQVRDLQRIRELQR